MTDLYRGHSIDASYQVSVYLANRFQRRRFFRNQPIRNNNCLWRPCLLTDQNKISNIYRGPFIDASYHFSIHLAKRFQRRRTLGIDQSEIRISCDGHIVMMNNLYRGPSIDVSYQVSVHLGKWCQRRRFFRNRLIRNKNCLWRPCLFMDHDEIINPYREHSIDASYQVSVHLAERF